MSDPHASNLPPEPAWKRLGPGLITGAADDDPSGIATYSQAGAQFGFHMLWTVILTFPLMAAIQMVSARLGVVTGRGLAANIRRVFPVGVLYGLVLLFCGGQPHQHRRRHCCHG
jgi:NRAMP (natural resistance-associated macrophage protein)-like metal ion transporter